MSVWLSPRRRWSRPTPHCPRKPEVGEVAVLEATRLSRPVGKRERPGLDAGPAAMLKQRRRNGLFSTSRMVRFHTLVGDPRPGRAAGGVGGGRLAV